MEENQILIGDSLTNDDDGSSDRMFYHRIRQDIKRLKEILIKEQADRMKSRKRSGEAFVDTIKQNDEKKKKKNGDSLGNLRVDKSSNGDANEADVLALDGDRAIHELALATRIRTRSKKTSCDDWTLTLPDCYSPCDLCANDTKK